MNNKLLHQRLKIDALKRAIACASLAAYVLTGIVSPNAFAILTAPFSLPIVEAATGINPVIHYQGKISLLAGSAVGNGTYNMRFKIYDAASGGNILWSENWTNATQRVTMTGGLFSVGLGTHVTMTGSVNFNTDNLYLQVEFDPGNDGTFEEIFAPRRRFASVPYAHNANTLDGIDSTKFIRNDNPNRQNFSGAIVFSTGGTAIRVVGAISGAIINAMNSLTTSGTLTVKGAVQFKNYTTCGIIKTDANGNLGCGSAAGTSTGNVLALGDSRYVRKSGDTMTGALTINVTGGNTSTIGLNVLNTISGAVIRAQKTLASSGTLVTESGAYFDGTTMVIQAGSNRVGIGTASPKTALEVVGTISGSLITQNGAGSNYFMGNVGIGSTTATYTLDVLNNVGLGARFRSTGGSSVFIESAGGGTSTLNLGSNIDGDIGSIFYSTSANSLSFQTNNAIQATIVSTGNLGLGTITPGSRLAVSGAVVIGNNIGSAAAKAQLDVKGSISGSLLTLSGLRSCTLKTSATGAVICGTDNGSTYYAGQGLSLNGSNSFSLNTTITGALVRFTTVSGSTVFARNQLVSSGTLVTESGAYFDGTTMVIQAGSNRVGIGTASPTSALHVVSPDNSSSTVIGGFYANNETQGIVFTYNGIYNPGGHIRMQANGNTIGIYEGSPTAQLHVQTALASRTALKLTAAASQTASMFEVLNSSLQVMSSIDKSGSGYFARALGVGTGTPGSKLAVSGAVIIGNNIGSSAAKAQLDVKGSISGSLLTLSNLRNCNLETSATGAVICGTDDGSTYYAGQGLSLNGSNSFSLNTTITGALVRFTTLSGSTVYAKNSLSSSGALTWEGFASGARLHVSSLITGSGGLDIEGTINAGNRVIGRTTSTTEGGIQAYGNGSGNQEFLSLHRGSDGYEFLSFSIESGVGVLITENGAGALKLRSSNVALQDTSGNNFASYVVANGWADSTTSMFNYIGAGTTALRIASTGGAYTRAAIFTQALQVTSLSGQFAAPVPRAMLEVINDTTSKIGSIVRGFTGQTADLFVVQNSNSGSLFTVGNLGQTTIFNTGSNALRVMGTISGSIIRAQKTLASSGTLVWEGAASGATLYVATSINGAGLSDCDASASALTWDSTTGRFGCDTTAGNTYTAGRGLTLAGTSFSTNDILTGSLIRFATVSGSLVKASTTLASSGTLVVEGATTLNGTTTVNAASTFNAAVTVNANITMEAARGMVYTHPLVGTVGFSPSDGSVIATHIAANDLRIDLDPDANNGGYANAVYFGKGHSLTAANVTTEVGLALFMSGSSPLTRLSLNKTAPTWATTKATLDVNGSISGSLLTLSGLRSCTLKTSATGAVICGTDNGTTYYAGQGLTLNGSNSFSLNSTITGALVRFTTVSGSTVFANTSLRSSGTLVFEGAGSGRSLYIGQTIRAGVSIASSGSLVWEGAASGATLYLGGKLEGAGLTDCDLSTQALRWDATTGRFSCGSAGATYTAGQGLSLSAGNAFSLNTTITGALVRFTTVSGSTVFARNTLVSSGTLLVKSLTKAGSGAAAFIGQEFQSGAYVYGSGAALLALDSYGASGGAKHILFGYRGNFDTNLFRSGAATLRTDGGFYIGGGLTIIGSTSGSIIHAEKTLSSSGTLVWEGAASGASLYVATSIRGSGLVDCDIAGTSKLLWDSTTGRFSCGTDTDTDTNTTYTAGQGLSLSAGNAFSLNQTITGALVRFTTVSGSTVYARNQLVSSGTLVTESGAYFDGTTMVIQAGSNRVGIGTATPSYALDVLGEIRGTVFNLVGGDTVTDMTMNDALISMRSTMALRWNNADNMAGSYDVGITRDGTSTLRITNGSTGVGNLRMGLGSGVVIRAGNTLASSGSLVWEGAGSGASLYIGGTFEGAGLTDCDLSTQVLKWDATTKRFSCGTVATTFGSGNVVALGDARYVRRSGGTMTGALTINVTGGNNSTIGLNVMNTISGSVIRAQKTLASSGSLVWEGAASGATLYLGGKLEGAGLTDCDLSTQVLKWDATTGRFSCGAATNFGSGNVVAIGDTRYVRKSGDTMTGSLTIQNGNTHTATSTALLNVRGTMSGQSIYVSGTGSSPVLMNKGGFVGMGTATPGAALHVVSGANHSTTIFERTGVNGGGAAFPFVMRTDGQTVGDFIGLRFEGKDSTGGIQNYGGIRAGIQNATNGLEDSSLDFVTFENGASNARLVISGSLVGIGSLAPKTKLEVAGTISGSNLTISNLRNCDTIDTDANGVLTCGTDQNAAAGLDLNTADARYVRRSGGSMTGALSISVTGGNNATIALNVLNTISGSVIRAQKTLASSGSLVWEGAASGATLYLGGKLEGAGLTDCDLSTQSLRWDATTGRFSCGSAGATYTAGQGLSLSAGNAFSLNQTITGALVRFTTVSGSTVFARNRLVSSGTLVTESGAIFDHGTFYISGESNRVGIGTTTPEAKLHILDGDLTEGNGVFIETINTELLEGVHQYALTVSNTANPLVDAEGLTVAGSFQAKTAVGNKVNYTNGAELIGGVMGASHNGQGYYELITGEKAHVYNAGTGSVGTVIGDWLNFGGNYTGTASGSISEAYGIWLNGLNDSSGTIGVMEGAHIRLTNNSTRAIGVGAAINILALTGSFTSKFGIYQQGREDVNYFAGKLGLGTTTPNANSKLDIIGGRLRSAGYASNTGYLLTNSANLSSQTNLNPGIAFFGGDNSNALYGADLGYNSTTSRYRTRLFSGQTNTDVALGVQTDSPALTQASFSEKMTIRGDSGNVGIGTASPGSKLAVSGAVIISNNAGSIAADAGLMLEVIGTASGRTLKAMNTLASSGTLVWEGAASGATLYLGGKLEGAGLTDCDTAGSSKLLWDATTGRFSCGTDQSAGSGLDVNTGDARYVNTSGDSMTGALVINVTGGNNSTVGLNVLNTISGSVISAQKTLASSGTLVWEGAGSGDSLYIDGNIGIGKANPTTRVTVFGTDPGAGTYSLGYRVENSATNAISMAIAGSRGAIGSTNATALDFITTNAVRMSIGTTGNIGIGNVTSPGSRLSVSGAVVIGNNLGTIAADAGLALEILGTASGRTIFAQNTLASSGTLVWEGAASGATLYLGGKLEGAGLTDCDTAGSSKLLWDATTGRFSCGTDQTGGGSSTFGSGNVVALGDARYVRRSGGTMTGALTINVTGGNNTTVGLNVLNTISGSVIRAQKTLASSGTLVWEGAGSGSSLTLAGGNITWSSSGAIVYNEFGNNVDVRMEGDTNAALFYLDASTDRIGLGKVDPKVRLDVLGTISGSLITQHGGGNNFFQGNVGIGKSPTVKLEVAGTISGALITQNGGGNNYILGSFGVGLTNPANIGTPNKMVVRSTTAVNSHAGQLALMDSTSAAQGVGGLLTFGGYYVGTSSDYTWAAIQGYKEQSSGTEGALVFYTKGTSTMTEKMRIRSNGYVGIGTTVPRSTLHVIGSGSFIGTLSGSKITSNSFASSGGLVIESLIKAGSGATTIVGAEFQTGAYVYGSGASALALDAYASSGAKAPNILFGYRGNFDTALYRFGTAGSGGLVLRTTSTRASTTAFQIVSQVNQTDNKVFRVTASGGVYADSKFNSNGADYAEWFRFSGTPLTAGEVVCIDVTKKNTVKRCANDADSNVMGIVSTNPGFVGNVITGADGIMPPGYTLVGLIGQVPAKVKIENGESIRPGDALTAGSTPGFARKARAGESTVGVALEGLESGQGVVNVLISRRNQSMTVEAVEEKVLKTIASMEIEDEVQLMVSSALGDLNVDQQITDEVSRQVDQFRNQGLAIEAIRAEVDYLKAELARMKSQTGSMRGHESTVMSGSSMGHLAASSLELDSTLTTGGDGRIGGDLYIDGALSASSLFVPNGLTIDGGVVMNGLLDTTELSVSSGATINGVLTINGSLKLGSGAFIDLGSGSLRMNDLIVENALFVMGDITIKGLATFLGDINVKGELIVSSNQAGFAMIPQSGTSVTIHFGTGFKATPVVTATPQGRVGAEWWVQNSSSTGFTIAIDGYAGQDVLFAWHALSTGTPITTRVEMTADGTIIFPMASDNIPVSSNMAWNACIRNLTMLDDEGLPLSCSRYHDNYTWTHPDLNMTFIWNTSVSPALLKIPDGYETQVTEDAQTIIDAIAGTDDGEEAEDGEDVEETNTGAIIEQPTTDTGAVIEEPIVEEPVVDEAAEETPVEEVVIEPVVEEPAPVEETPPPVETPTSPEGTEL